jgi:hypothetical protein
MAQYLIETETFKKILYDEFGKDLNIEWSKRGESAIAESFDDYIYYIKRVYSKKVSTSNIEYEQIVYDDSLEEFKVLKDSFHTPIIKALAISTNNYVFIYCQDKFDKNGMPTGEKIYLEFVNYEEGDI